MVRKINNKTRMKIVKQKRLLAIQQAKLNRALKIQASKLELARVKAQRIALIRQRRGISLAKLQQARIRLQRIAKGGSSVIRFLKRKKF